MVDPFPSLNCGCQVGFYHFHGLCNTHPNAMFTAAEMRVGEAYWATVSNAIATLQEPAHDPGRNRRARRLGCAGPVSHYRRRKAEQ